MKAHWLDRVTASVAPRWTTKRMRARAALDLWQRHYEGAGEGRRTQGWRRSTGDANAVIGPALSRLRINARELVRNNPYAESALATIVDHAVGWGITPKPRPANPKAAEAWRKWSSTTSCDADGRHDFYGLEKLVQRTVVESGEVLVRRRFRLPSDNLPMSLQIQILDPDFLDTSRDTAIAPASSGGGRTIQGIEYDGIGKRLGYWLFKEHPGSNLTGSTQSVMVPASEILHVFRASRPGQVRGPSWFAPVLLRFKDFDEFEDATLMKQKIAACLAVLTTDVDGSDTPLGTVDPAHPLIDSLEPGMVANLAPGRDVQIVQPPQARDYSDYSRTVLRAIATGLGVTYEDLTGDYADMPFSAARMSRIRHWARVEDWRWRMLVPQFCDPVWSWVMQAAIIAGEVSGDIPEAEWTAPPAPMVDPVNEGLAYQRNIRNGIQTWQDVCRERGYDPDEVLSELKADNKRFDDAEIILDSDPRNTTQAGQLQGKAAAAAKPAVAPAPAAAVAPGQTAAVDENLRGALAIWPKR